MQPVQLPLSFAPSRLRYELPLRHATTEEVAGMGINKDQVDGRLKEAAGKVQEVAGKVTGSTTEQVKGNLKKNLGAAQAELGDVREDANKAAKETRREEYRQDRNLP